MSRSVNKVILVGNLGKDCELKFTPGGVSCTKFSIATERRWKDKASGDWQSATDWHNIVLWRAEKVSEYLLKGQQVYIEGRLQSRSWDDKDGVKKYITEVVAESVILLGGGRRDESGPVSKPRSAGKAKESQDDYDPSQGWDDRDAPF